MQLFWQVTRGDSLYREVPFVDQYGAPVNLVGWTVQADFKKSYYDRAPYFSLTLDNGGLVFKNLDPATGILCFQAAVDQFDDLDLTVIPRNGEIVPFKLIVGDLKMIPPDGVGLMPSDGSRPTILLKVLAGVTA